MTPYALLPVDSVLRCEVDGSVYIRVGDEAEGPCWLAVYVETAARVAAGLWAPGDEHELLATGDLPKTGLVLLSPVAEKPVPTVEPDLVDDVEAMHDELVADLRAAGWLPPLAEAVTP